MRWMRRSVCLIALVLYATGLAAQATTGTLMGSVTSNGEALPGVTVTIVVAGTAGHALDGHR